MFTIFLHGYRAIRIAVQKHDTSLEVFTMMKIQVEVFEL